MNKLHVLITNQSLARHLIALQGADQAAELERLAVQGLRARRARKIKTKEAVIATAFTILLGGEIKWF
jgi:hypothetical protein